MRANLFDAQHGLFSSGAELFPLGWNGYVAELAPWAWWKLDDAPPGLVAADASGNSRPGTYLNGNFLAGGVYPYPLRQQASLVDESTWGITSGGAGNTEVVAAPPFSADLFGGTGSWTFGAIYQTTTTTSMHRWIQDHFNHHAVSFNYNTQTAAAQAGTLSLTFDTGMAAANTLVATGTGWNDGGRHLLLFGHDATADTISIWVDGVRVATRARAGTKPTSGSTYSTRDFSLMAFSPVAGIALDEFLFFNKTLTEDEHARLASFV
jgi:hypothetical protein